MNPKEKKACGKKTSRSGGYVKEGTIPVFITEKGNI